MSDRCPCSHCQDFRYNGKPNAALCHPLGCRCAVLAPIRSPYRRLLRNELKYRAKRDPAIARANITAALRLMREHEREGMPWRSERDCDSAVWIAARDLLMAERPPLPVKPLPQLPSGPCGCGGEGVRYHYNDIQGEYTTPCGCSHGMSDSHYL